jgi:ankyrin repeat protein
MEIENSISRHGGSFYFAFTFLLFLGTFRVEAQTVFSFPPCTPGIKYTQATREDDERSRRDGQELSKSIISKDYDETLFLIYTRGTRVEDSLKGDPFVRKVISDIHLLDAAQSNDIEGVKLAIEKLGANPNAANPPVDQLSITALMFASMCGYYEIASYLIDYGVDVDFWTNSTALHMAVMYERFDIVKLLLEKGADPNNFFESERGKGPTPIMRAKSKEMVCILLRFGADPNFTDGNGTSVLDDALAYIPGEPTDPEFIKTLLGGGADVTLKAGGTSVLDYVDKIKNVEVRDIIRDHEKYENIPDCRPVKKTNIRNEEDLHQIPKVGTLLPVFSIAFGL